MERSTGDYSEASVRPNSITNIKFALATSGCLIERNLIVFNVPKIAIFIIIVVMNRVVCFNENPYGKKLVQIKKATGGGA